MKELLLWVVLPSVAGAIQWYKSGEIQLLLCVGLIGMIVFIQLYVTKHQDQVFSQFDL